MTYVRSLEGFTPPPRFEPEADPFTKANIQESASADAGFSTIETITLEPVDEDPATPQTRNFTTDQAQLAKGWYRIVWEDASGDTFEGRAVYYRALPSWAPSVSEVAALIRARTKDSGGNEVGTFDSTTRPTGRQAERLIEMAVARVTTAVGTNLCTADIEADARDCAALYAAMLAEQSYYPEMTQAAGSSFNSLKALWEPAIKTLTEQVAETCGGEGDGGEATGAPVGHVSAAFDDREIIGPNGPMF